MHDTTLKQDGSGQSDRVTLAKWVVGGSLGGMIVFAAIMIISAKTGEAATAAERIFIMVVPLIASWVGTVLAFYFTGDSFAAATG